MRDKTYYVYTLARPNGEVFYIGKGKGDRIDGHEVEARKGVQSYKCNIIRKIWREGGEVIKSKVYEGLSEHEAFEHERMLIATYGRERLTNLTNGGEGAHHIPISSGPLAIGDYRAKAGLYKLQLASKAHLDYRTVLRAEKGKPIFRAKAVALAQTLSECVGKPPDY